MSVTVAETIRALKLAIVNLEKIEDKKYPVKGMFDEGGYSGDEMDMNDISFPIDIPCQEEIDELAEDGEEAAIIITACFTTSS